MPCPFARYHAPRRITRREFVHTTAYAAGAAMLLQCRSSTAPASTTATVSAVRGTDLASMTRDALDAIGGIDTVVHDGESVFIKPNMVTLPWGVDTDRFGNGECTKPEIIVAVADECLRAGASEIVIGDGSQMFTLPWDAARTLDGSTNLVREAVRLSERYGRPVRVASLENDSPGWVDVPSTTYLGTIAVSSLVARADRVISIPVAKTHSWAQLTLSLKNFVGVTSLERYGTWTGSAWDRGGEFDHSSPRAIAEIYLDVVAGVRPDLTVVDFSIGLEGDGPGISHGGRTVDVRDRLGAWLVLASTDLVAADATAARIMSHDASRITQLTLAHEMRLGEMREDRIELLGERLDALQMEWSPARLRGGG